MALNISIEMVTAILSAVLLLLPSVLSTEEAYMIPDSTDHGLGDLIRSIDRLSDLTNETSISLKEALKGVREQNPGGQGAGTPGGGWWHLLAFTSITQLHDQSLQLLQRIDQSRAKLVAGNGLKTYPKGLSGCHRNFEKVGDMCLGIYTGLLLSWQEARRHCKALVDPSHDLVADLAVPADDFKSLAERLRGEAESQFYIGATITYSDTFRWMVTGQEVHFAPETMFTTWLNYKCVIAAREDSKDLKGFPEFKITMANCHDKRPFICQHFPRDYWLSSYSMSVGSSIGDRLNHLP